MAASHAHSASRMASFIRILERHSPPLSAAAKQARGKKNPRKRPAPSSSASAASSYSWVHVQSCTEQRLGLKEWNARLATLQSYVPTVPEAALVSVLERVDGHVGEALKTFPSDLISDYDPHSEEEGAGGGVAHRRRLVVTAGGGDGGDGGAREAAASGRVTPPARFRYDLTTATATASSSSSSSSSSSVATTGAGAESEVQ